MLRKVAIVKNLKKYYLITLLFLFANGFSYAQVGNSVLIKCSDDSTTKYDQDKCKSANSGKVFAFQGQVWDVLSADKITVQINTQNYADVSFNSNIGDKVKKGQAISFTGRISKVGTGIMFRHEIDEAVQK